MNIYALARSILTRALSLILHFGQQFLRHFRDSSLSILIHRKNQQSNIYLDDSFPITNLRILYIYIYTQIQSNDKTSYRRTLDIERTTGQRLVASTTVDGFLPGDVLLPRIESRYRGNLGPARSTRFVSQIIRRVSDRISRQTCVR